MSDLGDGTPLETQLEALEESFASASGVAAQFDAEMKRIQGTFVETGKGVQGLDASLNRSLRGAFEGIIFDGKKLSDALQDVGRAMTRAALNAAIKPVTSHVTGLVTQGLGGLLKGILPFADGGSFAQGRVMPFANGGVVSGPVAFPMRGGLGLMGEAGPEAIMPLTRGADGKLGVRAQGGARPMQVVVNIATPDVEGFRRSQTQVAAQVSRMLGLGVRAR